VKAMCNRIAQARATAAPVEVPAVPKKSILKMILIIFKTIGIRMAKMQEFFNIFITLQIEMCPYLN
jgi:hypothetical protein